MGSLVGVMDGPDVDDEAVLRDAVPEAFKCPMGQEFSVKKGVEMDVISLGLGIVGDLERPEAAADVAFPKGVTAGKLEAVEDPADLNRERVV
jgi:hypothetical protein